MAQCTQWYGAEDGDGNAMPGTVYADFQSWNGSSWESIGTLTIPSGTPISNSLQEGDRFRVAPMPVSGYVTPSEMEFTACTTDRTLVYVVAVSSAEMEWISAPTNAETGDVLSIRCQCKNTGSVDCYFRMKLYDEDTSVLVHDYGESSKTPLANPGSSWNPAPAVVTMPDHDWNLICKVWVNDRTDPDDTLTKTIINGVGGPVIDSISTNPDPPKLCEVIQFLNMVTWNDDGGTGTRGVAWQYTKDTAEYTAETCGSELSWTQFSTDQWPKHTFTETDADITHIRCIVENKHGGHACVMIENFTMESTNGFTITVDPTLSGKKMVVYHVTPIIGTDLYYFPFTYVGGEWNSVVPTTVYKVPVGDISTDPSPAFDYRFNTGSFADGIDCVILVESSSMVGFSIFKAEDVFRIHSGSPTCVNLLATSEDVITEAVMGPVCDFFSIPRGTECEAFWAEFYDPVFIANYVSILQTGKDTLGNERELGFFDHLALPFAVLGSLPGLNLLPFGAFISKGLGGLAKSGIKLGDKAVQFTLDFAMDAANKVSTKDTWHFLDAMGQVTEEHATEICNALTAGDTTLADTLLRQYAGESKGWWDYHTLNDWLKDVMPEGAYNWLRTQIGLTEIGAGTVTNVAKQVPPLSADDVAKLADAALDSGVMDEATSAVYHSIKNLDAASVTKIDELKNILKNSPELSAKLVAKHKSILDNFVAETGDITEDEILTILNHVDIAPDDIVGLVSSFDDVPAVIRKLKGGDTYRSVLGSFFNTMDLYSEILISKPSQAKTFLKNSAGIGRKALDSTDPAKMANIPEAAQRVAGNQGELVADYCGGHIEPCFTETSDALFGAGKTAADEIVDATDEFVNEATSGWYTKGKAYTKARYAKANTWYDGLSKENKEKVVHRMVAAGMFFVVVVIYVIYKLVPADHVSPAYELKANIMEESYWVCEHASTAGSFDGLSAALVIFREDVMAAAKWCEDNKAALEGEETYEEFVRLVKLRMVEIGIFEARLEELGPTGVINCTSNTTFFYVDLDGKAAGFAYNTQMIQLKGIPVGSHTVKIYKHGCIPESCSKSINVTEDDTKWFDCQMTETGECSEVSGASIYITPLSPIVAESIAFNGSADSDDPIATWEWDFGDGNVDTGQAVTHGYITANTYIATLVVTNDCGNSDTATRAIVVTEEALAESTTLAIGCPVDAVGKEWSRCWDFEIYVGSKYTKCKPPHTFVFGTGVHCDCTAPHNLIDCELGTHTITIKKPGFDDVSKTVTLVKDTPVSWTPVMQLTTADVGSILCETTPQGAAIWISGVYRGDTNQIITDIPTGATVVTFKKVGYNDCGKTVTVIKDSTVTATCVLVAETTTGTIRLTSNQTGFAGYVDGILKGNSGANNYLDVPDVAVGSRTVKVYKGAGYTPEFCEGTVTVTDGGTVSYDCQMTAVTLPEHNIDLVVPVGSTLWVDGNLVGTTTIARLSTILRGLRR